MLIGLGAKNAILIVEFAKAAHERGNALEDAALEGARLRLRPILMTSFAFLLGFLPLASRRGAGGMARRVMGTAVIGGTVAASVIAIFLIPVTFYVVGRITDRSKKRKPKEAERGAAMRKTLACSCVICTMALSACMVGPDYQRPAVDTPEGWRFAEKEAQDTADTQWWRQFGDPVLDGLIESALKENKDVRIAAARVEQYIGRAMVVRAAQFPQVTGAAVPTRTEASKYINPPWGPTAKDPYSDYRLFLSASWQIDLWGQLRRATEGARADLLATREARRAVLIRSYRRWPPLIRTCWTWINSSRSQCRPSQAGRTPSSFSNCASTGASSRSLSCARQSPSTSRPLLQYRC